MQTQVINQLQVQVAQHNDSNPPLPRHAVVREVSESAGGLPYEAFDLTDSLRLNQVVAAHKAVLHIAGVSGTIRDDHPANLPCHDL